MKKQIIFLILLALAMFAILCIPALALTEAEVEAQVAATSKEAVTGNVLIWFLCAVAFLKVSQKVDSLLSSLGINVGRTGGPLLADAMVAAKGVAMIAKGGGRAIGSIGKQDGGSTNASAPGSVGGFFKGGLIGMAGRHITGSAVKTATTQTAAMHTAQKQSAASVSHTASQSEGIRTGGTHTASSTQSDSIHTAGSAQPGTVHTASTTQSGGVHTANTVQSGNVHTANSVQPGGTPISGSQPDGVRTDTTGIIQTENSVQSTAFQSENSIYSGQDHTGSESASDSTMFSESLVQQDGVIMTGQEGQFPAFSDSGPQVSTMDSGPSPSGADMIPDSQPGTILTSQPNSGPMPQPDAIPASPPGGVPGPASQTVNAQSVSQSGGTSQVSQSGGTSQVSQSANNSQTVHAGGGSQIHTQGGGVRSHTQTSTQSNRQSNTQTVRQTSIGGAVFARSLASGGRFANDVIGTVAKGDIRSTGSITGDLAAQSLGSYMGYTALGAGAQNVPRYSDVEIGGGRITGTEYMAGSQDGLAFGMYHAAQYTAPEGPHEKVYSADGTLWYKQYAQDAVERKPYKAPDGTVAYDEKIVKKLPNPPKRKDRI